MSRQESRMSQGKAPKREAVRCEYGESPTGEGGVQSGEGKPAFFALPSWTWLDLP